METPPNLRAAERLRHAADVLRRQNDADAHAVADGINAYLTGDASSLDDALGLRPEPGQRKAPTLARIAERDELLQRAAAEFYPGKRVSEQARALHRAITRYAASAWRHERSHIACPAHRAGTVQGVAWEILTLDEDPPGARQLRRILAMS